MRLKNNKIIMYVLIFTFILGSFGFVRVNSSFALSNVKIELSDYRPNVGNVTYTISFSTASSKKLYSDDSIDLHFVKKSGDNWIDNSQTVADISNTPYVIKINNVSCEHINYINLTQGSLQFLVPDDNAFANGVSRITVVILPQSGFTNPSPGTYAVYVKTVKETTPELSNEYKISEPELSNVSVNVTPSLINAVADYEISFKTSSFGYLSAGSDRIRIKFPSGTDLPSSIPKNIISVRANGVTKLVNTEIVPLGSNEVVFTVPEGLSIGSNDIVQVSFPKSCGIKNPEDSGEYKIIVDTEQSDGTYIDSPTESSPYTITASSISNVSVSVNPDQVNASPEITVSFDTSSIGTLSANSGKIYIEFPEGNSTFYVPQLLPKDKIAINGSNPKDVSVLGLLVTLTVAKSIASNEKVVVKFEKGSGIKNPSTPGAYKLKVWTSGDPDAVESPEFSISASSISQPVVIVTPSITGMNARYIITFTTGSSGALVINDKIYITFPAGTYIPFTISPNYITISGAACNKVDTIPSKEMIILSVPMVIGSGSTVPILIDSKAGIKNPSSPGNYTLKIHTDSETKDVSSKPYLISKGVSTSLIVTPPDPDGENGYYVTIPKIVIKVDNPSNLSYTIYYKWDDGEYKTYGGGQITVEQGKHTLYYYSVNQYKHKEQVHSKTFLVDSVKPILTITSPKYNSVVNDPDITIYGKTDPDASLTVTINKINKQIVTVNSDGKFQFSYTFTKNGFYSFTFTAKDKAGNISSTEITVHYISQRRIQLKVGKPRAYVNDKKIPLDAAPFILNNRVMVPIRFILQSLGATVDWDPIFKMVIITMPDGKRVRLQVGNSTAAKGQRIAQSDKFDEVPVKLDAPPVIKDDRVFVPVRFIAEAFGAEVDWDPEFMLVTIIYPKP